MSFQHCSEKETSSSVRGRKTGPGKKILSGLIILALVFSVLPATFFAFSKQAKAAEGDHIHAVNTECSTDTGQQETFTALSTVIGTLTNGVLPGGCYYLDQDITLTENLTVNGSVAICLNGHMLKGKTIGDTDPEGAVITVASGAGLDICDCNGDAGAYKFEAPDDGDGNPGAGFWKYITSDNPSAADCVITTVNGGIITGGNRSHGIENNGRLDLWGGTIVGNNTEGDGAGIITNTDAYMYGGSIKGNCVHTTDSFGGGVGVGYVSSGGGGGKVYGAFYMYGGIIEKNFGDLGSGIGSEHGEIDVHGGTVSGNEGTGGIYGETVTIGYGSIIEDNYGLICGGVLGVDLTITGGRITGNTTDVDRGMIFGAVVAMNSLNISGSPVIADNMAQGAECNVYLGGMGCNTITVNGQLNSDARIGVTADTAPAEGSPVDIALSFNDGAGETYDITAMDAGKFFSDSKTLYTEYDSTNKKVVLKVAPTHTHSVSTDCSTTAGDQVDFVPLTSRGGVIASGNYFLMGDVELGEELEIEDGVTVNLCLNGNILKGPSDSEAIWVREGGTLNLCDCGTSEKHYFDTASIPWTLDTTATEESGTVKAVNGGIIGCGARRGIYSSGTFTMYGGHIIGNEALGNGGGINSYGSFTMKGGSIRGNAADKNGAGLFNNGGTALIEAGEISNNATKPDDPSTEGFGGGICIEDGTVTMTGGTISGNSGVYGAGVCIANPTPSGPGVSEFIMTGGSIENNTGLIYGGGMAIEKDAEFIMTGGSVTGNKVTGAYGQGFGGGVIAEGTVLISGESVITGNTASVYGNNLINFSRTSVTDVKPIILTGALTGSASIGISTMGTLYLQAPSVAVESSTIAGKTYSMTSSDAAKFTSDAAGYTKYYDSTNKTVYLNKEYTVNFDVQSHGTAPASQTVEHGKLVTKPADPTDASLRFAGWFKESGCTNEWKFDTDTVTSATTLYALWTPETQVLLDGVSVDRSTAVSKAVSDSGKSHVIRVPEVSGGQSDNIMDLIDDIAAQAGNVDISLQVPAYEGTVTFDKAAVLAISGSKPAAATEIHVLVKEITDEEADKEVTREYEVTLVDQNSQSITANFGTGKATVTAEAPIGAAYAKVICTSVSPEEVIGVYEVSGDNVSFQTGHFSTFTMQAVTNPGPTTAPTTAPTAPSTTAPATKPATPSTAAPTTPGTKGPANTADTSDMVTWILMLGISAAAITGAIVYRRKASSKGKR